MFIQLNLTSDDCEVLMDLLKAERNDLPSLIRRTSNWIARDGLRGRMHVVEMLLSRLSQEVDEQTPHWDPAEFDLSSYRDEEDTRR